jgi:16S rRNA (uracil1498-N3)-methyltransferase
VPAPRFFVDLDLAVGIELVLPEAVAHHAQRVLRLRAGSDIVLFNGRGGEFAARLVVEGRRAAAQVHGFDAIERDSALPLALLQAWVAADKLDWLVEKAVELGAGRIVLMPAERSVVRLADERRARRIAHLRQLAIAACEQCGRNRLPQVDAADDLATALALAGPGTRLILAPQAQAALVPAVADGAVLLVGPEGGFTAAEVAQAAELGCQSVRLGPRVLRTETAGPAALAAVQAVHGDLAR